VTALGFVALVMPGWGTLRVAGATTLERLKPFFDSTPIFVPMFTLLGFTPEATQAVFRVGDSSTNIVTPLMPYMPFVIAAAQRYDPKAGTGTLISLMLPYSIAFLVMWTALLLVFYALGWDIGPGVGMRLG
jgi:aminobenzoyl-glutamate transport protein